METTSSDLYKSVLSDLDYTSIEEVKLSDKEILQVFPDLNESELDIIKNDLIIITEILYKSVR
jgi:hypothetical protein